MAIPAERFNHGLAPLRRCEVGKPARPVYLDLFVDQVADEDVDAAGGAHRLAYFVDVWNDVPRNREFDGGPYLHEAILQIDDDMSRSRRVQLVEHVQRATESLDAVQNVGRDFD